MAEKLEKLGKERSRVTVGENRRTGLIETSIPIAELPLIKMLWNSILTTSGAKLYLGTSIDHPKFMRLQIKVIPQEIIRQCKLNNIVSDGWVYICIGHGICGILVAGRISNDLLVKCMHVAGYHTCQFTPELW